MIQEDQIRYTEEVEPPRLFRTEFPYVFEAPPFQSEPFDLDLDSKVAPVCYAVFFIEAVEDSSSFDLESLSEKYTKGEFVNVGGIKSFRRNEFVSMPPSGGGPEDMIYLPKDSRMYLVSYIVDRELLGSYANAQKCLQEQKSIFDQILSTFTLY